MNQSEIVVEGRNLTIGYQVGKSGRKYIPV